MAEEEKPVLGERGKKIMAKIAQMDLDRIINEMNDGSYLTFIGVDDPEDWRRRCEEDVAACVARFPEGYKPKIKKMDLEKSVARMLKAAKRRRPKREDYMDE